ncbi:hypothetical protein [Tahibacter amnicola]|uniref:Uncharacterized protein n=1 Tax=Tahibacter amnicola TaxID=2976241 RepID=A0ABY6BL27_9GAMM|nr:hypothetical protein [Tahibacter amnicola]UXI70321.1 hypothetical protein N4264_11990 [Tahibacter amnicola]
MPRMILLFLAILVTPISNSQDCNCTDYPFEPNPPCFKVCAERISRNQNLSFNPALDKTVENAFRTIHEASKTQHIDFESITNEWQLKDTAEKIRRAQLEKQK